jgi:predicted lipid-binding transport protein (Tim44 family)
VNGPFIPGGHQIAGFFGLVVGGIFSLLALAVAIGLIFLLVRFLLIGTRAAQLYIAKNEPIRTIPPTQVASATTHPASTVPTRPTAPAPSAAATPAAASAPASTTPLPTTKPATTKATTPIATTKPPTKPRTPKIPPAS